MIPFQVLFKDGRLNEIEYKGKKIIRCFKLTKQGEYTLKLSFVQTNSPITQAIVIFFDDFDGEVYLCEKRVKIPKNRFPKLVFWEDSTPSSFELNIKLNSGSLSLCNGSDLIGTKEYCRCLYGGCAMICEELGENHLRFFCNDHENDDDFDDLIFELEIKPKA